MTLGSILRKLLVPARSRYYLAKYAQAEPGTVEWLVGTEFKYGGIVTHVPRKKVSPKDPRTTSELNQGGMIGGDRMLHHG
jgi:hypothetical protein